MLGYLPLRYKSRAMGFTLLGNRKEKESSIDGTVLFPLHELSSDRAGDKVNDGDHDDNPKQNNADTVPMTRA
ncbi:hypothetical protein PghCCS26_14190 [Paenibacillus glycanilyticus]|uniref:Uncharacterized protein n=1 Tax=Paenibacillus glycanilyticus TaxID=126569 RepID=A0ABQ6NGR8_9BACL|nr:hypothetical protein PghCCS26_14190 [Paenibacillus glycanilyticus]